MALDFSSQATVDAPDFSDQAVPDFSDKAAPVKSDPELAAREGSIRPQTTWEQIRNSPLLRLLLPEDATIRAAKEEMGGGGLTPGDIGADLMTRGPKLPESSSEDDAVVAQQFGKAGQVAMAAGNLGKSAVDALLTPGGAATLAVGGPAGKAVTAGFVGSQATDLPDEMRGAADTYYDPNASLQKKLEAVGQPLVTGGMMGLGALHLAAREPVQTPGQAVPPAAPQAGVSEFGGDVPPAPPDFSGQASVPEPAPVVPAPAAAVAAPPVPSDVAGNPVQSIDAGAIATRPDLMQFKRMDDADTGVNQDDKLAGEWDDLKAGNLLLWQPNDPAAYGLTGDQKYIVANGHHRFEFGEAQDVPAYNSQVIREADGYSAGDARSLAAEINIADGKGTIYDATKFLRNESATHGTDAALARAGSIGVKGRQAAAIAFEASPDTYDSFVNERITPDQTEAIASAAPASTDPRAEPLQRMGIKAAAEGTGPQGIRNLIQAVRLESAHVAPDQLDLFGADDSAMQAAEQLSKVAGRLQNTLSAEIRSTDAAARNATTAKAKGISFDKSPEEILADNARLKAERDRWQNWSLHPDLVSQVREYSRMERSEAGGDSASGSQQNQTQLEPLAADSYGYGKGTPPGVDAADVQAMVGELKAKVPGTVPATVVQHTADLPPPQRAQVEKALANGKLVSGWNDGDHVWLVADHMFDPKHAKAAVAEELLGHGGMDKLLTPQDLPRLYDTIKETRPKDFAALTADYDIDHGSAADRDKLVREFVAKRADQVAFGDPVWRRITDTVVSALGRVHMLDALFRGPALEAQIRGLARKAIGQAKDAAADTRPRNLRTPSDRSTPQFSQRQLTPAPPESQEDLPGRQRVATVLSGDASPDVKTAVAGDAPYQVRTFDQLKNEAQGIIRDNGGDGAFQMFLKNADTMQNDTRTALGAELDRAFRGEEQRARAQGDTARADAMAQRQVDLWKADAYGTELAQALSARRLYDDSSPQAKLKQAQGLFDEAAGNQWEAARPAAESVRQELASANAEAAEGLRQDPQVNAAARAAVNEHIIDSPETHAAVVMELAGPWSQSAAILEHARDAVHAKANELLNSAPRPPGFTPAQHLRAMMDDLASRAASIAIGHYQGAEPGTALKDKLQQRLGIGADQAAKLAKQLDAQFQKMVEAAKKKIPQRLATQRARQTAGLDATAADSAVDAAIRKQLRDLNVKLGGLLTQHTTVADAQGRAIADRLVLDSGLTGAAADQLRATIQRRWDALATAAKQSRLNQLAKMPGGMPRKIKGMLPDLIKLTNLGAFDSDKYFDLVKRKLGLPAMTDDLAREIVSRANALEKLPEGDLRDRAGVQLLNWIVQQRGLTGLDLPMGIYISNLLSGIKTPVKILFENGTLLASQTLATLRNPDLLRHPVAFVARPWAQGQLKGMLQSLEVLRSGIVTGVKEPGARPSSALEQRPFGKYDDWLNIWKYPMRVVAAAHVPLFKPALDLKATALAVDVAKREGLRGPALVQRVADIMGNTAQRVATAKAEVQRELLHAGYFARRQTGETLIDYGRRQAGEALDYQRRVYEYLDQQRNAALGPDAVQAARDYALHFTYLNKPYGFVGFIGEALRKAISSGQADHPAYAAALKTQVPFTTVASNIINEHLNWTPLGLGRAALSHYTGELYGEPIKDPAARGDLYARAAAGTVLASGLAYAVAKGYLQVNGPGPSTPQAQRQWRDAGNEPWSLTVAGRRYSYQNTPFASSLAVLGAWQDFKKFGHGDEADANTRLGFAMKAVFSQALAVPMLTGIHDLVEAVNPNGAEGDKGGKLEKLFARTAGNFVAPKWLKDVDQAFDSTVYDQTGVKALLASQVPFVRREGNPVLNRLGEPLQRGVWSSWTGPATQDPVWRTIADKGAWIPEPDRNHIVGDKKLGPNFYRSITPDELYQVVKDTGPAIRQRLEQAIDLPQTIGGKLYMPLPALDPADAKELVHKITDEEERKAYARLRF